MNRSRTPVGTLSFLGSLSILIATAVFAAPITS